MAPIRDEARRCLLALKLVETRQHVGHPQCRNPYHAVRLQSRLQDGLSPSRKPIILARARTHKSSLIGAALTKVRYAPLTAKFRSPPKRRDVPIGAISTLQTAARWARLLCVATELVHHCDPSW